MRFSECSVAGGDEPCCLFALDHALLCKQAKVNYIIHRLSRKSFQILGVHFIFGARFGIMREFHPLEEPMLRPKRLTRSEKKTALMQRAEALIDEMLNWTETTAKPNLTQIEDIALDLRQQFGQALSESAIGSQETVDPIALPACPQCGKTMRPKGPKDKTVVARVGELKLARSHFYCPACERGFFPPG
jgi:hypothetical protein